MIKVLLVEIFVVCIGLITDTDNHEEQRLELINRNGYTEICPEFKGTYFEEVYEILKRQFGKIGRVRILMET